MLTVNELRIGNIVKEVMEENFCTITAIDPFDIRTGEHKPYMAVESFCGIPLTPEILEKCGFEWDIYYQARTNGNYVLTEGELDSWRIAYGKRRADIIVYGIKYVHQLQNLIFALTGTELKYQP